MRLARIPVSAILILLGLLLQVSVFGRLQLPGSTPDILLLVVVGLALVYGPTGGCLVGFAAGLLADLAPPSDHAIGRYALVLCLMGYAAGLLRPEHGRQRSVSSALLVVAGAAIASTLLYAMVGALVGDTAARHVGLGQLVVTALLYDLLLAPFVVPAVMLIARRFGKDPLSVAEDDEGGPGLGSLTRYRTTREATAGPAYRKKRLLGAGKRP
ncbi:MULTISPECIES: rod shape-determining protein MreD [unclassified Streptomyces]|uniref:rod shape-determining protein MreD n=1 Tax=unclassified Streptomyces TaxID=2593676 RepID=UPI0005F98D7D|nr:MULTISPECIES: rod shape-determining protein MreD [unclassified Streptomyces]KJY31637.1 rod shape-determining protein MreD [Streptomyces sp. NRRL S-495]KOV38721.1 rod shape-determining protein MreD [Streptomyces sp. XY431]